MSIKGNLVGNVSPRTNWNQTDSARADYLVGREKIVESIADAKIAGTNAATAAEKNANSYAQTVAGTAEQNAKDYANSLHNVIPVTVVASGWSETAPFTQTIAIEGILETDTPHWGVVYSGENKVEQKEAFAVIDDLDTADGSVTFTCLEEKPAVDLTIQLEVNR